MGTSKKARMLALGEGSDELLLPSHGSLGALPIAMTGIVVT